MEIGGASTGGIANVNLKPEQLKKKQKKKTAESEIFAQENMQENQSADLFSTCL